MRTHVPHADEALTFRMLQIAAYHKVKVITATKAGIAMHSL
jgi:hypothetical protein